MQLVYNLALLVLQLFSSWTIFFVKLFASNYSNKMAPTEEALVEEGRERLRTPEGERSTTATKRRFWTFAICYMLPFA